MVKKNFSLEHALKAQRYSGDNAKRASRAPLKILVHGSDVGSHDHELFGSQ